MRTGQALTLAVAGTTLLFGIHGCGVEASAAYPTGAYYDYDVTDYPPPSYVATTEPFYYEGRPTYFYGGRWYYRDGGRWARYRSEPPALREHRLREPPMRRGYEGGRRGFPSGRPSGPRGGGHRR